MNRHFFKLITVVLLSSLLFTTCLKEGNETIVIPLPDGKIPTSVIPQDMQDSLTQNGFIIHEGMNPPTIDGKYHMDSVSKHYFSDNYINNFFDLYLYFKNQNPRGLINYSEGQRLHYNIDQQITNVEGQSSSAMVIGHDSCFTMYCYQDLSENSGPIELWHCRQATLVSGIKTEKGIKNCQYAFVMLEKDASSPFYLSPLLPLNTFRIWDDGDGLAEEIR